MQARLVHHSKEIPMKYLVLTICAALAGCAATPAPQASAPGATASASARPDTTKAVKHLREHVSYPASRAAILAACADTPEFTADEKKWMSDHLPDRTYASADEVAAALRL
jgi:hypothetical protein